MKKGILIFAHNNPEVDYALHAIIAGGLASKNLKVPASLVTDDSTEEWMKTSGIYDKAKSVFENIILVDRPQTDNTRKLYDGVENKVVPFVNANRCSAWDLTPYDRTLLIDSDFLIFSDRLAQYWDVEEDFLISKAINDIVDIDRLGVHDRYISDTGVHLFWATTIMFTKNEYSKSVFNMVDFVRNKYGYYGDLFRFSSRQYRNDISFSVAKHILDGFETNATMSLPPVLTALDRDMLSEVTDTGLLKFLVSPTLNDNYCLASTKGLDIHIMNKSSITRNADALLRLI
jgi:hypothetical protein